jgi:hypothetical protein
MFKFFLPGLVSIDRCSNITAPTYFHTEHLTFMLLTYSLFMQCFGVNDAGKRLCRSERPRHELWRASPLQKVRFSTAPIPD